MVTKPKETRPLYLGVARVSTDDQVENGHSLDAQDGRLREEAERRGANIELVPIPARSGKKMSPELRQVLDRLARGEADGLMVAKLDRLSRSVAVTSDVIAAAQQQGWNIVIADLGIDLSTWQGRSMAHMLATFAEVERELMSDRTKEGLRIAKAKGKHLGRPALVANDVVRRIVFERENGRSYRAIAADLSTSGVLSPEGRVVWQESTVRRIFDRSKVA